VDFAIFIFRPDDLSLIREKEHQVARDNIVFELGLFIGSIGINRSFIIQPRGVELKLPSDLAGITTADYEPNRHDGDISSAMNRPCTKIKSEIDRLGVLNREYISSNNMVYANPNKYELSNLDMRVLATCLESRTTSTSGISFYGITKNFDGDETLLKLSSVKLQRMGFIEIEVIVEEHNNHTEEYFGHKITDLGVDFLLNNEEKLTTKNNRRENITAATADFDDDIPF